MTTKAFNITRNETSTITVSRTQLMKRNLLDDMKRLLSGGTVH